MSVLGDRVWLPDAVAEGLEILGIELDKLASKGKRGRPSEPMESTFLQAMRNFIPRTRDFGGRTMPAISQEEIDYALSEIFSVVFRRRISETSFTRMRFRDKTRK